MFLIRQCTLLTAGGWRLKFCILKYIFTTDEETLSWLVSIQKLFVIHFKYNLITILIQNITELKIIINNIKKKKKELFSSLGRQKQAKKKNIVCQFTAVNSSKAVVKQV